MVSFDGKSSHSNQNSNSSGNTRGNTDSKKLHILRQQASAVSHALWPSDLHRSQVIEKNVQKRHDSLSNLQLFWTLQQVPASIPLLLVVTSTIVGGSIVTALLLHLWYILLLPTALLTLTTLVILPSLVQKLSRVSEQPTSTMQPLQSIQLTPRLFKSSPGIPPSSRRTFETPIPRTPLVRELETFDLSETGVEHFLEVNSGSGIRERAGGLR